LMGSAAWMVAYIGHSKEIEISAKKLSEKTK
jgi:hypothetical protein